MAWACTPYGAQLLLLLLPQEGRAGIAAAHGSRWVWGACVFIPCRLPLSDMLLPSIARHVFELVWTPPSCWAHCSIRVSVSDGCAVLLTPPPLFTFSPPPPTHTHPYCQM